MKGLPYKLYHQITPIIFVPLLATAITGIIYGFSNRFIQLPNIIVDSLIIIHQGLFLGEKIAPIYALLMGLGVFALGLKTLVESKNILLSWQNPQQNIGNIYHVLFLILAIPLAFCVETGVAYQIGRDWFGMSSQQTSVFLAIHGGSSLGKFWGFIYVLITGLSLVALSIIGYNMSRVSVVKRQQNQENSQKDSKISTSINIDNDIAILRKNIRLAIYLFSLVFIAILYSATTKLLISIVIIGIVFIVPALVVSEKIIGSWQNQKEIQAKLSEKEAESITMLKAVPDTMLRVSQDGICLSYMPAKAGKCFLLDGDIINQHINEFLAPEITQKFNKLIQLSLKTGSTRSYYFPISLDYEKQYYEARISPIGQTEVLIMVREVANFAQTLIEEAQEPQLPIENEAVKLLTEFELEQILKTTLEAIKKNPQDYILFCLAIEQTEPENHNYWYIDDNLMSQILAKIKIYLASNVIARLDNNGLVVLVSDCSLQQALVLVNDLHQSLNEFSTQLHNGRSTIKIKVDILEIDINSPDATSLMDKAKTTCETAQQKVNVNSFW